MSFEDVKNRTQVIFFPDNDAARHEILAVMQHAYETSPTANKLFEDWIKDPSRVIIFNFEPNLAQVRSLLGGDYRIIDIDLNWANSFLYIDNNGTAQGGAARVILHELVHALTTPILEDNWNLIDYKGEAVDFANEIFKELGIPEQNSYIGQSDTSQGPNADHILTLGRHYTFGAAIDRSVVVTPKINVKSTEWDSKNGGDLNDLLIGGKEDNELRGGSGDDFLYGNEGNDTLYGDAGDDYLDGGKGSDRLEGGTGYDQYIVDNQDTIMDEDGSGNVTLSKIGPDNVAIKTVKLGYAWRKEGETEYKDGFGNTFLYTEGKDGNKGHLIINGGLNIEKYDNGDLEIVLVEKPDPMEPIEALADKAAAMPSPIILDLDGDGVETTTLQSGTYFDHAADGFAEKSAWVGKDDGLLVRDLNGNGIIDSGRELFGSETLLANGKKAANGFEALKELDSNGDGVIDALDAAFSELRIWKDANGNGRTDDGELLTLAEAGVQSINLAYTNSNTVDAQGNAHQQIGSYTTTDGQTRKAADVWFAADPMYSIATERVDVPDDIAALPTARGYGKVRDLHQAMAMDSTGELQALVIAFTQADSVADRMALVRQIIYRWSGVQDINPASRINPGWNTVLGDGRKLEALEEFLGEEWVQGNSGWGANPGPDASRALNEAYNLLEALVYGQLMMQSHLKNLFEQIVWSWDKETQTAHGDLSRVALTLSSQIETDRGMGLDALGDFLLSLKATGQLDDVGLDAFKAALLPLGTEVTQTFDAALSGWISNNTGSDGNDLLRGTELDDIIDGKGGDSMNPRFGQCQQRRRFPGHSPANTMPGRSRRMPRFHTKRSSRTCHQIFS